MNIFETIGRVLVAGLLVAVGSWMLQEVADKTWFKILYITTLNFGLCVGAFLVLTKTEAFLDLTKTDTK